MGCRGSGRPRNSRRRLLPAASGRSGSHSSRLWPWHTETDCAPISTCSWAADRNGSARRIRAPERPMLMPARVSGTMRPLSGPSWVQITTSGPASDRVREEQPSTASGGRATILTGSPPRWRPRTTVASRLATERGSSSRGNHWKSSPGKRCSSSPDSSGPSTTGRPIVFHSVGRSWRSPKMCSSKAFPLCRLHPVPPARCAGGGDVDLWTTERGSWRAPDPRVPCPQVVTSDTMGRLDWVR